MIICAIPKDFRGRSVVMERRPFKAQRVLIRNGYFYCRSSRFWSGRVFFFAQVSLHESQKVTWCFSRLFCRYEWDAANLHAVLRWNDENQWKPVHLKRHRGMNHSQRFVLNVFGNRSVYFCCGRKPYGRVIGRNLWVVCSRLVKMEIRMVFFSLALCTFFQSHRNFTSKRRKKRLEYSIRCE